MGNDEIGAKIYDMIVQKIKEHGWMIQASHNEEFEFAYTIGLYPRFGFELVIAGLHMELAGGVLQIIHRKIDEITKFGENIELIPNGLIRFYRCLRSEDDQVSNIVIQADNYFGMSVPIVQVIVGAVDGKFFDDPEVDDIVKNAQPLLFAQPAPSVLH